MSRITRFLDTQTTVLGPLRVEAVAGTSDMARDGHRVLMSGMDFSTFMRSGIILWGHDPDQPVGVPFSCRVDTAGNLRLTVDFAPEGTSERADEVRRLVKSGVVRNLSIGFSPVEAEPLDPRNPRGGQLIKRSELLEVSFVSVPADAGAIVTARAAGTGADPDFHERQRIIRELAFDNVHPELAQADRRKAVREMQARMYRQEAQFAEVEYRQHRAQQAALERKRIEERRRRAWAYTALTGRLGG